MADVPTFGLNDPIASPEEVEAMLPTGQIAHPLPGFGEDDEVQTPVTFGADDVDVKDDTHSVFTEEARKTFNIFNRTAGDAFAEGIGGFVDLTNAALGIVGLESEEPLGGSESLKDLFELFNFSDDDRSKDEESLAGTIGKFVGFGAAFVLPLGGAVKGVAEVARFARPAPTTITGRVVHQMAEQLLTRPGRLAAGEAIAATGAGVGEFAAKQKFPDSEAAQVIGALTGALVPAGAVAGTVASVRLASNLPGARLIKRLVQSFTKTSGRVRAEARVQAVARDPEVAAAALVSGGVLKKAALTPAQEAGDVGLLSLERSIIESSEQLKSKADQQITEATKAIREAVTDIGEGVGPEKAVETIEKARAYLQGLLDIRLKVAARKADEAIAELSPTATRQDANLAVERELDEAFKAATKQETDLYNLVPLEVQASIAGPKEDFAALVVSTPRALQDDIPAVARRFLDPDSPEVFDDLMPIKELQGLRSRLLAEARKLRAAGERNAARLTEDVAESVLISMGAKAGQVEGEVGQLLRTALDFSKDKATRFFKESSVSKILGTTKQGGDVIAPELALESTIAGGGPRARVEAKALQTAVEKTGSVPKLRGAIEDFLVDDFRRRAVVEGVLNQNRAKTFMARNQDILEDFPELRNKFTKAITTDKASIAAQARAEGIAKRLNDPKISKAAVFIQEPVEDAMKRIAKTFRPGKTMQELVKEAGRDPTGDALKGLKTAFGDFILKQTTKDTDIGLEFIKGRKFKELLTSGKTGRMAKALLSKDELARYDVIADTAIKVQKAVAATARPEGVLADAPNLMFTVLVRIGGAQIGRKVAQATGGGTVQTPGIVSGLFQKLLTKATQDPGSRLLHDAAQNKELFTALLAPLGKGGAPTKAAKKALNAWAAAIIADTVTPSDTEVEDVVGEDIEGGIGEEVEGDDGDIQAKEGVALDDLQPEALSATELAKPILEAAGVDFVVTSTGLGDRANVKSVEDTKHNTGQAFDVRIRDLPSDNRQAIVDQLKEALGDDYDVVLESDHIHIEFDRKTK